jgi:O-antigen ligase
MMNNSKAGTLRDHVLVLPRSRDPVAWERTADIFAVLIAAALPWSTSLVGIFVVGWLVVLAPTIDLRSFVLTLRRPFCALPIMLFVLAVVGTLWSEAPWSARLYAINPTAKLLVLPALIYHFHRSNRGAWVFIAFLASCMLLLVMSWIVALEPRLTIKPIAEYGVPVKNYIDQSQEFALCAVALAYLSVKFLDQRRFLAGTLFASLALSFVINMAFVVVSRTALFTTPLMLIIFAFLHLKRRGIVVTICISATLIGAVWFTSPTLRERTGSILSQYGLYKKSNEATSVGLRLEFWRKSLQFFKEAPLFGHGTGSTRGLFAQAAVGQTGAAGEVIGNPHNQTLNVAVQWGALGVLVLYAMWLVHLLLFRGSDLGSSIGLLVVIQNIITSLFNSHLFDFHEGWMYVLGVGVAGGMVLKRRSCDAEAIALEQHGRKQASQRSASGLG